MYLSYSYDHIGQNASKFARYYIAQIFLMCVLKAHSASLMMSEFAKNDKFFQRLKVSDQPESLVLEAKQTEYPPAW